MGIGSKFINFSLIERKLVSWIRLINSKNVFFLGVCFVFMLCCVVWFVVFVIFSGLLSRLVLVCFVMIWLI